MIYFLYYRFCYLNLNKMVEYICANSKCRKTIQSVLVERKIRCPFCGEKSLEKKQDRILDVVKAR